MDIPAVLFGMLALLNLVGSVLAFSGRYFRSAVPSAVNRAYGFGLLASGIGAGGICAGRIAQVLVIQILGFSLMVLGVVLLSRIRKLMTTGHLNYPPA